MIALALLLPGCDGDDPAAERNVVSGQPAGIAAAIELFVMCQGDVVRHPLVQRIVEAYEREPGRADGDAK